MIVSSCKFLSNPVYASHPTVIRMGDTTFCATWDDTGNVGVVSLTESELKDFIISNDSDNGEHIYLFDVDDIKLTFLYVSCVLLGVKIGRAHV